MLDLCRVLFELSSDDRLSILQELKKEAASVIQGSNGVLRIDLSQNELKTLASDKKSKEEKK